MGERVGESCALAGHSSLLTPGEAGHVINAQSMPLAACAVALPTVGQGKAEAPKTAEERTPRPQLAPGVCSAVASVALLALV